MRVRRSPGYGSRSSRLGARRPRLARRRSRHRSALSAARAADGRIAAPRESCSTSSRPRTSGRPRERSKAKLEVLERGTGRRARCSSHAGVRAHGDDGRDRPLRPPGGALPARARPRSARRRDVRLCASSERDRARVLGRARNGSLGSRAGSGDRPSRGRGRRPWRSRSSIRAEAEAERRSRGRESTLAGERRADRGASLFDPPRSTRCGSPAVRPSDSRRRRGAARDRIGGEPVAVTMRTPGHDEELALGFCVTEGLRPTARVPDDLAANTVEVDAAGFDPERLRRHFYTSSSCGVCGKGAIEAVQVERAARRERARGLGGRRRVASRSACARRSAAFAATGGLHATGLFDAERRRSCACARTSAGTTRWTRSSAGRSPRGSFRSPRTCSASAGGSRSSSCRRRRSRGAPCSSPSARRRRSRSSSRRIAASRCAAGCATARDGLHRAVADRRSGDGRAARRRRVRAVRLAEGARAVSRRDARGARVAAAGRRLRRGRRGRKGGRRARAAVSRPRRRSPSALPSSASSRAPRPRTRPASSSRSRPRSSRPSCSRAGRSARRPADGPASRRLHEVDASRARARVAAGELSLRGVNETVVDSTSGSSRTSTRAMDLVEARRSPTGHAMTGRRARRWSSGSRARATRATRWSGTSTCSSSCDDA